MVYIAHIRESDGKIQSVKEHLLGVQVLAEDYGAKIGVTHLAGLAGLLHDLGKYSTEFQDYLKQAVYNPDAPPRRGSVDHSTAGAKLLYVLYHSGSPSHLEWILAEVIGNAILSHHSYLHDFLDPGLESPYLCRVRHKELPEFDRCRQLFYEQVIAEAEFQEYVSKAKMELDAFIQNASPGNSEGKMMFLTKYIFSALIDADRTNTRLFEENKPEQHFPVDHKTLFAAYYQRLMAEIDSYREGDNSANAINVLRREMSDQCDRYAENPSGIYTLSIPTGGGKTLASLRYALHHALTHNKKRIIYIVPFTTIIEQNANEIRRVLADNDHILEHHSNVIDDANDDDENQDGQVNASQKLKLAKDNWDAPIIFSTMVQFLNVFYAKGSRNIRRLHNLSEAVIIFDEVQKVPIRCVSLFNQALNFLKFHAHSSLILCTATQPALDFVEHKLELNSDAEIISDLQAVHEAFKRVEIIDRATDETFDNAKLADFIQGKLTEAKSMLVILNTKTVVKKLYNLMRQSDVPVYHLSTSMCAAHRSLILDEVKEHLKHNQPVVCISTQLIEAGVDVSFECVVRSLAGLDSIAQAAGRCNRHGKMGIKQVYVIDHEEENLEYLPEIMKGKEIARKILTDINRNPEAYRGNLISDAAMERYFQEFYTELKGNLNYSIKKLKKDMTELLAANRKASSYCIQYEEENRSKLPLFIINSYRTAAENFEVIDSSTTAVIVPYGRGREIIAELNGAAKIDDLGRLLREAQLYSVNLFRYELDLLIQDGALASLFDGKVLALQERAYSKEFGVDLRGDSGYEFSMY